MSLTEEEDPPCPCPFLPRALWAHVVQHALVAAAQDGYRAVLKRAATLLAVSHHVAAAAREVPLSLDLRQGAEEDLLLLPPLLTSLPLRELLLAPRHAFGAEALLRCDALVTLSAHSLRRLTASVACTDTLQRYSGLQVLHLHAGVVERLYADVLHDLHLLHLGVHGYRKVELATLPLAASMQVLEVTPRPEAMRCQFSVQLPQGMRLRRLTVHGSFNTVLSARAAPEVCIDTLALCRQCSTAHIEAQQVVWQLPVRFRGQVEAEEALSAALLDPEARWTRLELHLLEGTVVELLPTLGPAGLPPSRSMLDLERLAEAVRRRSDGTATASLRRGSVSIFHPWILVLERGLHTSDAALAEEEGAQ